MRRKPQELIAGVLLLLCVPLFWPHFANVVPNLLNLVRYRGLSYIFEGPEQFTLVLSDFVYVFVPFFALIAGISALIGKVKDASILTGISLLTVFIGSCISTLSWYFAGGFFSIGAVAIFEQVIFGRYNEYMYVSNRENQWFSYAPVTILLTSSLILLYLLLKKSANSAKPFDFQQPITVPINPPRFPVTTIATGMKKCPECAELIQGEAVKCRFCNYRYG